MKIYREFNKVSTLFITLLLFSLSTAYGAQSGYLEYNSVLFDYSKLNAAEIQKEADEYFDKFLTSSDELFKENYLNAAMSKYYVLTKIDYSQIKPYIQLARIYDEKIITDWQKNIFTRLQTLIQITLMPIFISENFIIKEMITKELCVTTTSHTITD